jgi:hypothetical protein
MPDAEPSATQRALEEFSRTFDGPSTGPASQGHRGARGGGRRTFVRAGEGACHLGFRLTPAPAPVVESARPDIARVTAERDRERQRVSLSNAAGLLTTDC